MIRVPWFDKQIGYEIVQSTEGYRSLVLARTSGALRPDRQLPRRGYFPVIQTDLSQPLRKQNQPGETNGRSSCFGGATPVDARHLRGHVAQVPVIGQPSLADRPQFDPCSAELPRRSPHKAHRGASGFRAWLPKPRIPFSNVAPNRSLILGMTSLRRKFLE